MHSANLSQIVFWTVAGTMTAASVILLLRPVLKAGVSSETRRVAGVLTALVPAVSLALYFQLGRPDLVEWRTRPVLPPTIAASVDKLTADVRQNPDDIQAWLLLGEVYDKVQRYGEAAAAYRRAAELDPATPAYKALLGQALVKRDGDAVRPEALVWFSRARDEPLSRYYLALGVAQKGNWKEALTAWQALEAGVPPDAPARPAIEARIADARRALGLGRR